MTFSDHAKDAEKLRQDTINNLAMGMELSAIGFAAHPTTPRHFAPENTQATITRRKGHIGIYKGGL